MYGYKTTEFILSLILLAGAYAFLFLTMPLDMWAYCVTLISSCYIYSCGLRKKNRAALITSKKTEAIIYFLGVSILSHALYRKEIEPNTWLFCITVISCSYILSRGHAKGMTQPVKYHLPL